MSYETLLPCPFCGGLNLQSGGDDKFVGVHCLACEATGPNHYITGREWNTRAADAGVREACLRLANIARQAEWDQDNQITLAYRGNELAGEVGEACNVIKKLERERMGIRGSRATIEQLAEELADVVICADLIAMDAGIDLLGQAVPSKFNATSEKVGLKTRMSTTPAQSPADTTEGE